MKYGRTHALKTAKGKIGVGVALALLGVAALLAARSGGVTDRLICGAIALGGAAFVWFGAREDRAEKKQARGDEEK